MKQMLLGLDAFRRRIEKQHTLYKKIHITFGQNTSKCVPLNTTPFADDLIELFGPALAQRKAKINLKDVFECFYHPRSSSLIVATAGTSLLCQSPSKKKHFILRHIGCTLWHPFLGLEMINVGIVGSIYSGPVIVRAESACAPSFLFNSQRCNCCYQWASTKEIAAHWHSINVPDIENPDDLEKWVSSQFSKQGSHHIPASDQGPGILLVYLDSQGGMGSGFSPDEFTFDLSSRAFLRQLGENSVEQLYHTSIKEGYEALGLPPDGRQEANGSGYQVLPILLDWLDASQEILLLSNNKGKIQALTENGYHCRRVQSLGKIDQLGLREARQRNQDFKHMDIGNSFTSFEEEVERLKQEVAELCFA